MDWGGLWQGVASNLVSAVLILGGGALLALLRLKYPNYADLGRYAFTGAATTAVVLFALLGKGIITRSPPEVTPENLEGYIRKWTDDAGLPIAKAPPSEQTTYFGYVITTTGGVSISVFRAKEKPGYLQMQCALSMSPEHLGMLAKLSKEQADEVIEEIVLEMDRAHIGFIMTTAFPLGLPIPTVVTTRPDIFQQTITVTEPIAISKELNEGVFLARINQIDSDVSLVRSVTDLTLRLYIRSRGKMPGLILR
jgi:hypothetical protein